MFHVGREQTVTINEIPCHLNRLTRAIIREWMEWAQHFLPNPIPSIVDHFDTFTEDIQKTIANQAILTAESRKNFSSVEMVALWTSTIGTLKTVALLLGGDVDLASDALNEHGINTLLSWIEVARGTLVLADHQLEEIAYQKAGLLPTPTIDNRVTDWGEIDRSIFIATGLTPIEVDDLTYAELIVLCGKQQELKPEEQMQRAELWHKLTARQKLEIVLMQ